MFSLYMIIFNRVLYIMYKKWNQQDTIQWMKDEVNEVLQM
jgi:hypothetical protein